MDDMTYTKLISIKKDINIFLENLILFSKQYNHTITQSEKDFFIFLSKHIIFFKYLYLYAEQRYILKVIISDLYYYIISILKNETRYMYLNERSIIENYTRMVMRTSVEKDHITSNIFDLLKEKKFYFDFTNDDYSLIKSEYTTACGYIHGSDMLKEHLSFIFEECLENKPIKNINNYYDVMKKIFHIYDKMLISEYGYIINGCFHREKTIFKYLLGQKCLDLLFKVI